MFDWFFHLLGLKSPREMRELEMQYHLDLRKATLQLARAMANDLTGERRDEAFRQIEAAESQLEAIRRKA